LERIVTKVGDAITATAGERVKPPRNRERRVRDRLHDQIVAWAEVIRVAQEEAQEESDESESDNAETINLLIANKEKGVITTEELTHTASECYNNEATNQSPDHLIECMKKTYIDTHRPRRAGPKQNKFMAGPEQKSMRLIEEYVRANASSLFIGGKVRTRRRHRQQRKSPKTINNKQ
jgi:hypothetical protein